jgi:ABC-type transport system involved in multi-copper enzyme maturation permease subunit
MILERLRRIGLVAGFDFLESLRSRKAAGLLVLYLAGAIGSTGLFIYILHSIESALATNLGVSPTASTGTMTTALLKSEEFRKIVDNLVGDRDLGRALVSLPPLALFYSWLSMTFVPILVTLASGDAISYEVSTGSVRYALFRSDRFSWSMGKLLGETALMSFGLLAGALGVWVMGAIFMAGFEWIASAEWLLRFSVRVWFFGFAYLGLAMGASQLTRSVNGSRALALVLLFGAVLLGHLADIPWIAKHFPILSGSFCELFPNAHSLDLWRPALVDRLPALVMLLALGVAYYAAGYARFARRDQ